MAVGWGNGLQLPRSASQPAFWHFALGLCSSLVGQTPVPIAHGAPLAPTPLTIDRCVCARVDHALPVVVWGTGQDGRAQAPHGGVAPGGECGAWAAAATLAAGNVPSAPVTCVLAAVAIEADPPPGAVLAVWLQMPGRWRPAVAAWAAVR